MALVAGWIVAAFGLALLWHLSVGARPVPLAEVWQALVAPDPAVFEHAVIRDLRLPRALSAAAVGAALGVAGAVMQALTRNPLAEPGTLGLMAGASSAVILGIGWFGLAGTAWVPAVAALGALGAAALVWAIAMAVPGGARPLAMVLAGAAVSLFLGALDGIAVLLDEDTFRTFRVWSAGSLGGADLATLGLAAPWLGAGLILSLLLSRRLTALSMGEDVAASLGLDVARLRVAAVVAVVALTAGSVAVAGLMGFVGLVIPHVARLLVGADYGRIVPVSAWLGATYLVAADTVARVALAPTEIATGLVTALVGGPAFLWLVRTRA